MRHINSLIKGSLILIIMSLLSAPISNLNAASAKQMYYEIRVYHVKNPAQAEQVDSYLRDAYLPALHKAGILSVGIFKPVASDTAFGKLIFVFIPYKTINQYVKLPSMLEKDKDYQKNGKSFFDAPFNDPPFTRYESILLKAFSEMPVFAPPAFTNPAGERIYELRSYESATDAKAAKKIEMFNKGGEVALFKKLGFNPVFFGEVLMGSDKPNLMYMTAFQDMETHDSKWMTFRDAPEWKEMSGLKEYENLVSKAIIYLLNPTSYSDF
jgi:hypothetical protein